MLCPRVSSTSALHSVNSPVRLRLAKFEKIRYGLTKYRLLKNDSSSESRRCSDGWTKDGCMICLATHICAKRVNRKTRSGPMSASVD